MRAAKRRDEIPFGDDQEELVIRKRAIVGPKKRQKRRQPIADIIVVLRVAIGVDKLLDTIDLAPDEHLVHELRNKRPVCSRLFKVGDLS